jgi:hypothetical protein
MHLRSCMRHCLHANCSAHLGNDIAAPAPNREISLGILDGLPAHNITLRADKRARLSYFPDMDSEEIIALFVFGFFASAIIFGLAAFVL